MRVPVGEAEGGGGGGGGVGGAGPRERGAEVGEEATADGGAVRRGATVAVVDGVFAAAGGGRGRGGHGAGGRCEERR